MMTANTARKRKLSTRELVAIARHFNDDPTEFLEDTDTLTGEVILEQYLDWHWRKASAPLAE